MLALLIFPMVDKALHDLGHLNDDHCGVKETHYCQTEHICSICDYIFSSSNTPPNTHEQLNMFLVYSENYASVLISNTTTSPKFKLSLRGPPLKT
jgi:hypothetical protein